MDSTVPIRFAETVRTRRVALVVDDIDAMLDLLEIALDASDFDVLRASSVAEAREIFQARSDEIDLLLTDVRVEGNSGLELARDLIQAKPTLRVVAMSGFAVDTRFLHGGGEIEFLQKPFSSSELKSKLKFIFTCQPDLLTVTVSGINAGAYAVSTTCTKSPAGGTPTTAMYGRTCLDTALPRQQGQTRPGAVLKS